jgi:WD40 repeat protein
MGEVVSEYKGHHKSNKYHSSIKFSKDNTYIIQASEDHRVVLYDLVSKNELLSLRGHTRPVVSLDIHPTEHGRLVSGSADATIKIWKYLG